MNPKQRDGCYQTSDYMVTLAFAAFPCVGFVLLSKHTRSRSHGAVLVVLVHGAGVCQAPHPLRAGGRPWLGQCGFQLGAAQS